MLDFCFAASVAKLLKKMGSTHSIVVSKEQQHPSDISFADSDQNFHWLSNDQVKAVIEAVRKNTKKSIKDNLMSRKYAVAFKISLRDISS